MEEHICVFGLSYLVLGILLSFHIADFVSSVCYFFLMLFLDVSLRI